MRELAFEEMEQVAGGSITKIILDILKAVGISLIWDNREKIMEFIAKNETLRLQQQEAHYEALRQCRILNNSSL